MTTSSVILVVDAQPFVRLLLSRSTRLACPHALVLAADTVADARRMVLQPVSVVLTEYCLPDGTGLDVLGAARAEDPGRPVIIVSADTRAAIPAAAAGATAFFALPLDLDAFGRVLGQFCCGKRSF